MKRIDLAYLPIIGRGEQINIICAMHEIEVNYLLSTPLGMISIKIKKQLLELSLDER